MSTDESLLEQAARVRVLAHAPYSRFLVGAAVLDEHGNVHVGCNVENASYPSGACAETAAIGAMIAAGGRQIVKVAIVGGHDEPETCLPCGGCRQRIAEFADESTRVIVLGADAIKTYSIAQLLPEAFRLDPD